MATFVHWVIKIFSMHNMVNTVMERTPTTTAKLYLAMTAADLSEKKKQVHLSVETIKIMPAIFACHKEETLHKSPFSEIFWQHIV